MNVEGLRQEYEDLVIGHELCIIHVIYIYMYYDCVNSDMNISRKKCCFKTI